MPEIEAPEGSYGAAKGELAVAMEELKAAILKEFPFPWWILNAMVRIANFIQRLTGRKEDDTGTPAI